MEGKKKKSIFKRWWFWVIVIIIIIAATSGNDNEPKQATTKQEDQAVVGENKEEEKEEVVEKEPIYNIGDSFKTGDLGVTILEVEEKKEFKSDNEFIENVTTDGKFIAVTATLTNNDTKPRTFSSMQFNIIDNQGRKFDTYTDAKLMMILGDKDIFLEECNPGMSRTGIFVFEVPEDVNEYSLKVYSGVGFEAKTSATVKLK